MKKKVKKRVAARAKAEAKSYPPLRFEDVRRDVVAAATPLKASRVAIEKVGPKYRGYFDVEGSVFSFRLSGEGFSCYPVDPESEDAARVELERLLDVEQVASYEAQGRIT